MTKTQRKRIEREILEAYRKLAFSDNNDAVMLCFDENMSEEKLYSLDLMCVQEIKKPKTGGIEIKFVDRVKALSGLSDFILAESSDTSVDTSILDAINRAAERISDNDAGGENDEN